MSRFFHVSVKLPNFGVILPRPLDPIYILPSSHDDAHGKVNGGSYMYPASHLIARSHLSFPL